jgi:hypothetical protein
MRYRTASLQEDWLLRNVFFVYAVFNRDYKRQLRGRWEETWAAYSWWREQAPPSKQGTLNAVLARRYGESQGILTDIQACGCSCTALQLHHGEMYSGGVVSGSNSSTVLCAESFLLCWTGSLYSSKGSYYYDNDINIGMQSFLGLFAYGV